MRTVIFLGFVLLSLTQLKEAPSEKSLNIISWILTFTAVMDIADFIKNIFIRK